MLRAADADARGGAIAFLCAIEHACAERILSAEVGREDLARSRIAGAIERASSRLIARSTTITGRRPR
jgi:hypothetical protein